VKTFLVASGLSLTLLLSACAPEPTERPEAEAQSLEARLSELEDRLVGAGSVELDFEIMAEGAISVALEGGLRLGHDSISLHASGDFAGQAVDLFLESSAESMTFGNRSDPVSSPRPESLQQALFIGLTRMGILHNLARLTAGAPPDRSDGGVEEWVTVDGFSQERADGPRGGLTSLSFNLTVSGVPSGSAVLDLSDEGLPIERRQVVFFPEGEMRVTEQYSRVMIRP
jgi:hypothetical protein